MKCFIEMAIVEDMRSPFSPAARISQLQNLIAWERLKACICLRYKSFNKIYITNHKVAPELLNRID